MKAPYSFDLRTSEFVPVGRVTPDELSATLSCLAQNRVGVTRVVDVTGAMTGVRTSARIFTPSATTFIGSVVITHAAMTTPFTVHETVTETGTSAAGEVIEAFADRTRIMPTTAAQFSGTAVLTGGTSSLTATGTGKTVSTKTLTGYWGYSYDPAAANSGVFGQVVSNTTSALTFDRDLETTGTRFVLFATEAQAYDAVTVTRAADATVGTFYGDLTLQNGETISNSTNGQVTVHGNLGVLPGTTGGLVIKAAEAAATLTGATTDIAVAVPSGAVILGTQLRVDTLITSAAAVSWSAAFITGSTASIASAQAFTKNTKVNTAYNANGASAITSATPNIRITPNEGTFTAGNIRAIVYYLTFDTMADAA